MKRILKAIYYRVPTVRMRSVARVSLDAELRRQFPRLPGEGVILDVGAKHSPYRKLLPAGARCLRLDIDPASEPDLCCDLHAIDAEDATFDAVVATEVLEHLREPRRAIEEIRRVLKPGGACLLSTRFIHPFHSDPKDFYRFTADSLGDLFADFAEAEVIPHGNRLQAIWLLATRGPLGALVLNALNPLIGRTRAGNTLCPLGFVVFARK